MDEGVFNVMRNNCNQPDTHSKAGKYGELLSMLLTKNWPKEGQQTHTSSLDPQTVKFLLTWKPMTKYLKFFGKLRSYLPNV